MTPKLPAKLKDAPIFALGLVILGAGAFFAYRDFGRREAEHVATLEELAREREYNYELVKALAEKEGTINAFQSTISEISNTVGTLDKLAHTDEELLKKYSKVYFLNENYAPPALVEIDRPLLNPGATNTQILARVNPYLEDLMRAAQSDGVRLLVASAYRSFATQSSLKSSYKVTYGSGANAFSADQGYSEHQLGTTVDFTTDKLGANFSGFAKEVAYQWLLNNAHRYGFVLSYPDKNSFYVFEPWHWRYVGVELAKRLHDDGKYFYDLDQREIDTYLIKLFE